METLKKIFSKKYFTIFYICLPLILIYHVWFSSTLITAGDFWPLFSSQYKIYHFLPQIWDNRIGIGFGSNTLAVLWGYFFINFPFFITGKVFNLSFPIAERIGYLFPLFILMNISSYLFARKFFQEKILIFLCALIFTTNTYVLLIVSGGQISIATAYFLLALVMLSFINLIYPLYFLAKNSIKHLRQNILIAGLVLGLTSMVDLRSAYVACIAIFCYLFFIFLYMKLINLDFNRNHFSRIYKSIFLLFFTLLIFLLLNSYWLLPFLLIKNSFVVMGLGGQYTSASAVQFFSFAKFENVLGLLHPLWPENIFGKVGFMKPEYLILPLLAFSSLLFLKLKKQNIQTKTSESNFLIFHILFFLLLALVGIFLTKGDTDPFGNIYLFAFLHIPGFIMFRDSTKFYVLIALAYSILIPFALLRISQIFKNSSLTFVKKINLNIIGLIFLIFWLFTIKEAIFFQIGGIDKSTSIPKDYITLENLLENQNNFFRTLWVPQEQRFAYYDENHPTVDANQLLNTSDDKKITGYFTHNFYQNKSLNTLLQQDSIAYIIVPIDSEHELFLDDRKYSQKMRSHIINNLNKVSYLKKVKGFTNLAVYQVSNPKPLFSFKESSNLNENFSVQTINQTMYKINVFSALENNLEFNQHFDNNWQLQYNNTIISPTNIHGMNNFYIKRPGNYTLQYQPQKYLTIGAYITFATLILVCFTYYLAKFL